MDSKSKHVIGSSLIEFLVALTLFCLGITFASYHLVSIDNYWERASAQKLLTQNAHLANAILNFSQEIDLDFIDTVLNYESTQKTTNLIECEISEHNSPLHTCFVSIQTELKNQTLERSITNTIYIDAN